MGRVTKRKSADLAETLLKNNAEKIRRNELILQKEFYDIAFAQIPLRVKEVYKTNQEFFTVTQKVDLSWKSDVIKFSSLHPLPGNHWNVYKGVLNDYDFHILKIKVDAFNQQQREYNALFQNLEIVIFNLVSEKRIIEEFPILAPLFKKGSLDLPSNLNNIKSKIL